MSDVVIKAENLSKKYSVVRSRERADLVTARAAIADAFVRGVGRMKKLAAGHLQPASTADDFWALQDVSFEIKRGSIVGIVGSNGAGKSTLLKLLSRITEPTSGRAVIEGQVASLLEVGTGFHPELTGRENIFLNGAILGMTRAEVRGRFDEIVDFAGVQQFLDTPVKRYSSGMYVRLAFAVAAHLEPEILIVDEVLAVGDAEFQKKCLGKINDIARGGDRTVLVVSHNMGLITSICTNALLLSQGRLMRSGSAVDVVNDYYSAGGSSHVLNLLNAPRKIGDQFAHLLEARVESLGASSDSDFDIASPLRVVMRYHIDQKADGPLTPVFQFRTAQGQVAFVGHGTAAHSDEVGSYEVTCVVPGDLLNNDVYFIDIGLQVARLGGHYIFNEESALRINVVEKSMAPTNDNVIVSQFGGAVRPKLDWNVRRVS